MVLGASLSFCAIVALPAPAHAQLQGIVGNDCGFLGKNCAGNEGVKIINTELNAYIDAALILVDVIAIAFILYAGFQYITSAGDESRARTAKMQIAYVAAGLIVINGANLILNALAHPATDTVALENYFWLFLQFASRFITIAAAAYIIYAGFQYITSAGDEGRARTAKMQILYAAVGMVVGLSADILVDAINSADPAGPYSLINTYINFALALTQVVAAAYLVYAGFQYITSAGDEGRARTAKMQIAYAAAGLLITRFAWLIVINVQTVNPSPIADLIRLLANAAIFLLGAVSVVYLIYAGFLYITSRGETDTTNQAKRQIAFALIGIIVATFASAISAAVRTGQPGTIAAQIEAILLRVITVGEFIAGTVAVIYLIYAGFRYITSAGDTAAADEARRQILYAIIGLIVIGLAFPIANLFLDQNFNTSELLGKIRDIISQVLFLVGIAAVIYLIFAGMLYITSGGDEEQARRARRQIFYAIIGILIIGFSLMIVNFVAGLV